LAFASGQFIGNQPRIKKLKRVLSYESYYKRLQIKRVPIARKPISLIDKNFNQNIKCNTHILVIIVGCFLDGEPELQTKIDV
jgi:hypothetical protein